MHKDFTPQDILAYVYGELDKECAERLEIILEQDELLRNEVESLRDIKALLDSKKVEQLPSSSSIERVLQYAAEKAESKFGVGLYQ